MNQAAGHLANLSIRRFLADTAIGLVLMLMTVREVGAGIKLSDISATTLVALLIVAQVAGLLVNAFSYVLLGRHVADATRLIGRHRWWAVHTKHVFRYAET